MSTTSGHIFEVRPGGSDTANGGGFDPTNGSMAADLAATSATSAAPVVTSASYSFAAGDVGHWLFIKSGTSWTSGWYRVASASGGAATLSAAAGAGFLHASGLPYAPSTAAGVAAVASPTAGTWAMDYSQSDAPAVAFTDMVIDAATNTRFTSAANPAGKNMVGNMIAVTSGAGFTVQRTYIASVAAGVATCGDSLGTLSATGGQAGLGGGFAGPGVACSAITSFNQQVIFIKYGATPYSCSSTPTVAGGRPSPPYGVTIYGYDTGRSTSGADANRPTLAAASASMTLLLPQNSGSGRIFNLILDNPSSNASVSLASFGTASATVSRVAFRRSTGTALALSAGGRVTDSEFDSCSGSATATFSGASYWMFRCSAHDCSATQPGLTLNTVTATLVDCLFARSSGQTVLTGSNSTVYLINVTAAPTSTTGTAAFDLANMTAFADGCLAVGATGTAFGFAGGTLTNCAGHGNAAGNYNAASIARGFVALSASPFASPGSGDFSPNAAAGGGAAIRGAGIPSGYPGLSTTSCPDIGAVQSASSAAGGVIINRVS